MNYIINRTEEGLTRYPMHTHKNYEIMLYLEGAGYMRTEVGDFPFRRGTVVIVPPNIKHGSVSENGFKNISIEGSFNQYLHMDTVTSFEDNISQDGMALARMIYENRYGNAAYLNALCTAYVCFLMQQLDVESVIRQRVNAIAFEISENALNAEIDLASILSKSGYAEDYVRARFKKITGKTPNEFLTEIRIRHACFLIDIYKVELSLTEIAERCGYTDYPYFSKKFKSVMKISPREYQKY
ncbi:MAG: helix-turn-helix domain-containing protein [Ruminococcaceae bacterium]|nr:helix-turn-helix domain-containing protein [Oscillospiraceae bacterium]